MASIVPDEGLEFISDQILNDTSVTGFEIWQVSAGDGTTNLDEGDTQLDNELYRANKPDSVVSIEDSSQAGLITVKITLSGGTEVPAGSTITEFGIFAVDPNDAPTDDTTDGKDVMLHRELRGGVTLSSGDRKTFEIPYRVESK